jgi:hypothetical protein
MAADDNGPVVGGGETRALEVGPVHVGRSAAGGHNCRARDHMV